MFAGAGPGSGDPLKGAARSASWRDFATVARIARIAPGSSTVAIKPGALYSAASEIPRARASAALCGLTLATTHTRGRSSGDPPVGPSRDA